MGATGVGAFSIEAVVSILTQEASANLLNLSGQATKAGDTIVNAFSGISKTATKMANDANPVLGGIVNYLTQMAAYTVKFGTAMNDSLAHIRVSTTATGAEMSNLQNNILSLYNTNIQSLGEVVNVVETVRRSMGNMGVDVDKVSKGILDFTKITGDQAKPTIEGLRNVMEQWNIPASDAVTILDKLVALYRATGVTGTEITRGLTQSAVVLQQVGYGFDESATMMAAFSRAGVPATQLSQALSRLIKNTTTDTAQFSKELAALGFHLDAAGRPLESSRDILDTVLRKLRDSKGATEEAGEAFDLLGIRGTAKLETAFKDLAMINKSANEELKNSAGLASNLSREFDKLSISNRITLIGKTFLSPFTEEGNGMVGSGLVNSVLSGFEDMARMVAYAGTSTNTPEKLKKAQEKYEASPTARESDYNQTHLFNLSPGEMTTDEKKSQQGWIGQYDSYLRRKFPRLDNMPANTIEKAENLAFSKLQPFTPEFDKEISSYDDKDRRLIEEYVGAKRYYEEKIKAFTDAARGGVSGEALFYKFTGISDERAKTKIALKKQFAEYGELETQVRAEEAKRLTTNAFDLKDTYEKKLGEVTPDKFGTRMSSLDFIKKYKTQSADEELMKQYGLIGGVRYDKSKKKMVETSIGPDAAKTELTSMIESLRLARTEGKITAEAYYAAMGQIRAMAEKMHNLGSLTGKGGVEYLYKIQGLTGKEQTAALKDWAKANEDAMKASINLHQTNEMAEANMVKKIIDSGMVTGKEKEALVNKEKQLYAHAYDERYKVELDITKLTTTNTEIRRAELDKELRGLEKIISALDVERYKRIKLNEIAWQEFKDQARFHEGIIAFNEGDTQSKLYNINVQEKDLLRHYDRIGELKNKRVNEYKEKNFVLSRDVRSGKIDTDEIKELRDKDKEDYQRALNEKKTIEDYFEKQRMEVIHNQFKTEQEYTSQVIALKQGETKGKLAQLETQYQDLKFKHIIPSVQLEEWKKAQTDQILYEQKKAYEELSISAIQFTQGETAAKIKQFQIQYEELKHKMGESIELEKWATNERAKIFEDDRKFHEGIQNKILEAQGQTRDLKMRSIEDEIDQLRRQGASEVEIQRLVTEEKKKFYEDEKKAKQDAMGLEKPGSPIKTLEQAINETNTFSFFGETGGVNGIKQISDSEVNNRFARMMNIDSARAQIKNRFESRYTEQINPRFDNLNAGDMIMQGNLQQNQDSSKQIQLGKLYDRLNSRYGGDINKAPAYLRKEIEELTGNGFSGYESDTSKFITNIGNQFSESNNTYKNKALDQSIPGYGKQADQATYDRIINGIREGLNGAQIIIHMDNEGNLKTKDVKINSLTSSSNQLRNHGTSPYNTGRS